MISSKTSDCTSSRRIKIIFLSEEKSNLIDSSKMTSLLSKGEYSKYLIAKVEIKVSIMTMQILFIIFFIQGKKIIVNMIIIDQRLASK
jgi:hypothetical protein